MRGLWFSAALLIAAGLVHILLLDLDTQVAWALALAPGAMIVLAVTLWSRPTQAEAARTADRWAGAKSLLISAWELGRRNDNLPAVAPLVMARAERSIPRWERRIGAVSHAKLGSHPVLAMALFLIGALLLQAPGKRQPSIQTAITPIDHTTSESTTAPQTLAAAIKNIDLSLNTPGEESSISSHQREPAPPGTGAPPTATAAADKIETAATAPGSNDLVRASTDASSINSRKPKIESGVKQGPTDHMENDSSGPASGGGNLAGLGRGGPRQSPATQNSAIGLETVEIKRSTGGGAGAADPRAQGQELGTPGTIVAENRRKGAVAAARLAAGMEAPGRYTPAEQQLIASYFQSMRSGE